MSIRKLAKEKLKRFVTGLHWAPRQQKALEPAPALVPPAWGHTQIFHIYGDSDIGRSFGIRPPGSAATPSAALHPELEEYSPRRQESRAFLTEQGVASAINPHNVQRSATLDSVTPVYHGYTPPVSADRMEFSLAEIEEERESLLNRAKEDDMDAYRPSVSQTRQAPARKHNRTYHRHTIRKKPSLKIYIPQYSSQKPARRQRRRAGSLWSDVQGKLPFSTNYDTFDTPSDHHVMSSNRPDAKAPPIFGFPTTTEESSDESPCSPEDAGPPLSPLHLGPGFQQPGESFHHAGEQLGEGPVYPWRNEQERQEMYNRYTESPLPWPPLLTGFASRLYPGTDYHSHQQNYPQDASQPPNYNSAAFQHNPAQAPYYKLASFGSAGAENDATPLANSYNAGQTFPACKPGPIHVSRMTAELTQIIRDMNALAQQAAVLAYRLEAYASA
ncbi:hypothetical protein BKA70DRAFT_1492004 [Coprinopsis sp. MPI-PUGE-AT-0042]|nr:hypothetical protein BKA70DRAFT_1492004 [Coprinopsis sp. MPI-PUGE-AT-0042]